MSWENDAAGYLAELSRSPGGIQPSTIGQVWDSEWKRGGLDTIGGVGQPFADARQDLVTAIETASGKPIEAYAAEKGIRLGSGVTQADDVRLLGTLADTLPEEHRKKIDPLKDIRLNAAKKAQKIEADADEIANATYGLSAHATAFIAGVARQAADPVNAAAMVATAPLGAARGASLLATIAREAGANAAAQAAVEPVIEPQRERLGLDSGFGRAAGNVIEAGIGGGVLSGLFHVAGRGVRSLRGERPAAESDQRVSTEGQVIPPAPETRVAESASPSGEPPALPPAGPLTPARPVEQFAPEDFHAAGDLAERDHVIDAMSPLDTAEGRLDHAASVDIAVRAIESGQSVSDLLTREGVRLSPQIERLSELQLGEIAQHATALEQRAAAARSAIDAQISRLDAGQMSIDERGMLANGLRREVNEVKAEVDAVRQRIAALDDPSTAARLNAVSEELSAPGTAAARRRNLLAEKSVIEETLAASAEQTARERASLLQEVKALDKLQERKERAASKAEAAHRSAVDVASGRRAELAGEMETRETVLASQREIIGGELRRSIATLAADGYGIRLARGEAQDLADFVLLAKADELPAALAGVTDDLVGRAAARQTAALDRVATKLVGISRLNGRDLPADVARSLALQLERADGDEVIKIIDHIVGERKSIVLAEVPFPASEKAKPVEVPKEKPPVAATDKPPVTVKTAADPALAVNAARVLEETGDIEITLQNPDGTTRTLKASDALREVEDDAHAAAELQACIVGATEEAT